MRDTSSFNIKEFDYRKEGSYYIVWIEESKFIELDEASFKILQQLSQGINPEQIKENYKKENNEPLELDEFIATLQDLGFIGEPKKGKKASLSFIKPSHVSWLYSKPTLLLYSAIIVTGLILLSFNPKYFPTYTDYFITDSYFTTLILTFIIGMILLSIHELSHLLSARAKGIYGNIGVGLRLYFPVAETNITGLWKLERNERYLPILAGMLSDLLIASIGVITLYIYDNRVITSQPFSNELVKASILILWYGLLWQFMLFIKTDLYYALSNLLGVRNLFEESWTLILNRVNSLFGRNVIEQRFPDKDRKVIVIYSILVLFFSTYSVTAFILYGIPIYSIIIINSIQNIRLGSYSLMENLFVLFFTALQLSAFIYFIINSLIRFLRK